MLADCVLEGDEELEKEDTLGVDEILEKDELLADRLEAILVVVLEMDKEDEEVLIIALRVVVLVIDGMKLA